MGVAQLKMDFADPDLPDHIPVSKLYNVALMNLVRDASLTGFRTMVLTSPHDSPLFVSPEKLKAALVTWYRSHASFISHPPSSQGQAYLTKYSTHVDDAAVFYTKSPSSPAPKISASLFPPSKNDKPYCPFCFARCGKKFPHTAEKCKSSAGTRLPSNPSPPSSLSQAGRAYLAAYQVDPTSDASVNALLSLSEYLA